MPIINLRYGNKSFNSDDLKKHIQRMGKNYIIQGQTHRNRTEHPKPNSLDCWLRDNYAQNKNTNQAENKVIEDLVNTGEFEEGIFPCPDNCGKKCKGIKIVQRCKMPDKTI